MRAALLPGLLTALASLASGHLFNQSPLAKTTPSLSQAPEYRERLLSLHKNLIEVKSLSGDEADVGEYLSDVLTSIGYEVQKQAVPPGQGTPEGADRWNIIAWPRGSDGLDNQEARTKLLVTSHIDCVPPHIPYGIEDGPITKDTQIWGRCSVDAKGSVAAMITALDALLTSNAVDKKDIMFLFVVGEETAGQGMRCFSESLQKRDVPYRFDSVIFGEPTEGKLACGHKGGLFGRVRAQGKAAHSGYPWLGKSANELMIRAFAKILDTDLGSSERFGNTTTNVGLFRGGIASNVVPEHAEVELAVRVAIGPESDGHLRVSEEIMQIFNEVDGMAFTLEVNNGYGAVETTCGIEGFEDIVVNYGTDVPNLKGNHTRYLYGPGTILVAHGDHENITVGDLEKAVEDYQKLILHALKSS